MKVTTRSNYRIEVTPDMWGSSLADHDAVMKHLDHMAEEIRSREDVYDTTLTYDTNEECSHCGLPWTVWTAEDAARHPEEPEEIGFPACCEDAQDEFRAARTNPTTTKET